MNRPVRASCFNVSCMSRCLLSLLPLALALPVAAAHKTGDYTGTWSSNTVKAQGKLHLNIRQTSDGAHCKLDYRTPEGQMVVARHLSCHISGNELRGQYEVPGDAGVSRIALRAAWTGNSLAGTYSETGPDGKPADSGTWTVSPTH